MLARSLPVGSQPTLKPRAAPPIIKGVPVINAADFLGRGKASTPPSAEVVSQIMSAAKTWGFFQLVNHGVSEELMDEHDRAMRSFFALPLDKKLPCKRTKGNPMGYFNDEFTKQKMDLKECFDFRRIPRLDLPDDAPENVDLDGVNRWPEDQPHFKEINTSYVLEMERVSYKLLEAFALGLNLPGDALHHLFLNDHSSFMRLNYYPVMRDAPADALGISDHKDAGFLTVLVQDEVAGLQVLRNGVWHTVPPQKGALVINVGDMAQVLTNDVFYASNHRVLPSRKADRYSRAFFFNPIYSKDIDPLPSCANDGVIYYRPINWGEFRMKRFEGDMANVGPEVQIDWYRLDRTDAPAIATE